MMDANLIEILKKQGYRIAQNITLRTWKKDDLIERIRNLEHNWAAALERCENQYKLLVKYRWHDLRKNPDDLPDTTRKIVIVIDILGVTFEENGYFLQQENKFKLQSIWTGERNNWTYREYDLKEGMKVIAWKEIEPFEEVEE